MMVDKINKIGVATNFHMHFVRATVSVAGLFDPPMAVKGIALWFKGYF